MLISKLQNIHNVDEADFCMEEGEFAAMRRAYAHGEDVCVLDIECHVDNVPAHNYYNVVLKCGTVLEAISGEHLIGIQNWK